MISFVRFHFMFTIKIIGNIKRKKWTKIWTIYLFWLLHKFRICFFTPSWIVSFHCLCHRYVLNQWHKNRLNHEPKQNIKENVLNFCYKKDKLASITTLTFSFSFSTFHKFIYTMMYVMSVVILTAALTLTLTMFGCLYWTI